MIEEIDELLLSSKFLKQREYWLGKLSPGIEKTELLLKNRRSQITGSGEEGEEVESSEIVITEEVFHRLRKLGKNSDLSIFIILLTVLKLLIFKYSGSEDVVVVSPVYKNNVTLETINDALFIRDLLDAQSTFVDLLINVRKSVLEAYDNQDYPSRKLLEFLFPREQGNGSISDIVCLLSNIHDRNMIEKVGESIVFFFEREEKRVNARIFYDNNIYEKTYIQLISRYFVRILESSTRDIKGKLSQLALCSKEEERQLIFAFNDTSAEYPKEKNLLELFEEQVEKTPFHMAAIYNNRMLTYKELNGKANRLARFFIAKGTGRGHVIAMMVDSSLEVIAGILAILKAGGVFLPIDNEYPAARKQFILEDSETGVLLTQRHVFNRDKETIQRVSLREIVFLDDERSYTGESTNPGIPRDPLDLAYIIYTSGTTGNPKGVMVSHRGIVNYISWAAKMYVKNETLSFPLYTSIAFDLTMTSIFTPLATGNAVVVYGDEEKELIIEKIIDDNKVGVVKVTPSHLKLIRDKIPPGSRSSIKRFIVGGEELETDLAADISENFNHNVEIYNEYGPTEATVGCMIYKYDPERDQGRAVPIGKPISNMHIYILDEHLRPVPFGIPGELCISGDGVAAGYLKREELTALKFVEDPFYKEKPMYRSGDLARWLPDGNIDFLGRIDSQVKVRGYRIELGEIESQLLTHPRIKEAVVLAKDDETGDKYLCAYVVPESDGTFDQGLSMAEDLRTYLSASLPHYMVPAFFIPVERIPLTSNGKIDSKALPEPEKTLSTEYVAPRNKVEKKLVEIWSEVLQVEPGLIGINHNFFESGGQSLKAVILLSRIHKEFNVRIPLSEVFEIPTIKGLSGWISEAAEDTYSAIEPVEKKEFYALSSAQKRLYILHNMESDNVSYNMPHIVQLQSNIDKQRLEDTFGMLIARHESLRTSFELINENPVQRIHDVVDFAIDYYEITETEANSLITRFTRRFDLSNAPLLRVSLISVGSSQRILFIDMHHIITDGTSQDILERDFMALYSGEKLAPLPLHYKDFSEWQNSGLQVELINRQGAYWLKEFSDEVPVLTLPTDYSRPVVQSFEGSLVNFALDAEETKIIKNIATENDITLYMCLLTVFNILFSKLSGQEDIVFGTPVAARRHADLQHVIGMLVNTLPMRNYPSGDKTFNAFLKEVKQRTLEAYENQEYPFEDLVDRISLRRDAGRNPLFDVMLNFLNQSDSPREIPSVQTSPPYSHIKATSRFDMAFSASEVGEIVHFELEYSSRLFTAASIDRFISYLKNIVRDLSVNNERKLANIEMITAEEKKEILRIAGGPEDTPVVGQTVHELFEDKVKELPDGTALVFDGKHLSYGELNRRANQLAGMLRERGVRPGTVVGVMVERSFDMIIGILAVLKAGGAYLPLDPGYPEQRILAMLEDSKAPLLLTCGDLVGRFSITALKNMKLGIEELHITPPRAQIKDFDGLPIPDRTLIDYERYHRYIGEAPVKNSITMQATRGCPYNCLYCHKIWPKTHVVRSAENIFKEISWAYDAGVRRFVFIDDIFNLDKANSSLLLEKVIKSPMDIQLFFPNGFRADILTKDFIDLMMEAGTVNLDVALESASPRIQKLIRKNLNLEKFRENIQYITEKYPHVILEMEMMHGFPTETEEEAMMTLDFLKCLKWVHFPNLHVLKIFPNTDICKLAIENGISEELIEHSANLAFHQLPDTLPFPKSFTRQFQAKFMGEYFLSKERLLHVLPHQMNILTEDELVQKYDSYLSSEIKSFSDILHYMGITREELGDVELKQDDYSRAPEFCQKIKKHFPVKHTQEDAFRILLLDLSQLFTQEHEHMLHHQVEEPLGLLYLISYLNKKFEHHIHGKVLKSRIDFDGYDELKRIILDFQPDLIGIRTLSYYKEFFHHAVLMMRQWGVDVPIVAGGPYASSDYNLILQDLNVDLVVLGEGEITLGQLVEKMMDNDGKLPGEDVLRDIHGIAYQKNKTQVVKKRNRREIILLDEISGELAEYPVNNPDNGNQADDLVYVIYTSGSTGKPKGVMLEHRNLLNLIRYQYEHTNIDFSRVLQFTTISFDVSAQEIFSTLLAGGKLSLLDKDIPGDIPKLFKVVEKERLNTLFLPASFLKFVMNEEDYVRLIPGDLSHIVTAGEQAIINETFKTFLRENNVYFHNHYGPSETHVVTALTLGPGDYIPEIPSIGRPVLNTAIYILDKGGHLVPMGVPGELYIGGAQVGRGYLGSEQLTLERFGLNPFVKGERIYRTGDLAKWLPDGNIEFLGRIDHQVKIRGFRVELGEIEGQLLNHPGIRETVVLAGSGETGGKYLCAYIVPDRELTISELREYLSNDLPDYMLPSYFVFLEKIPLTPNGKVDRRLLPSPELKAEGDYTAPRNETDRRLAKIWAGILGMEEGVIGINDNFFELGGHSLKATILTARVHKEFHVELPLAEVFKTPTISGISQFIEQAAENRYAFIESVEKKEYYPLSSTQKRLYILQQMDWRNTAYNMPEVIFLPVEPDWERLADTFNKLIERHESLRTSFHMINGEPVQKVHDHVDFKFEDNKLETFVRPFDLLKAPLLRVGMVKREQGGYLLLVDMHHIISDGVSHDILEKDFVAILEGEAIPPLRLQYKDFSVWQNNRKDQNSLIRQEKYWLKEFDGEIPVLDLPTDYSRPPIQSFEGAALEFEIPGQEIKLLKAMALQQGSTPYMVTLSIFYVLLSKLGNQEDIIVGTPVAGRRHADLEAIIGMFVNTLALRNFPGGEKTFSDFIQEVKNHTLAAFENQEYPFEELVEKVTISRDAGRNPLFDVMFTYRSAGADTDSRANRDRTVEGELRKYDIGNRTSKFDLTLSAVEIDAKLLLEFEYCTKLFKKKTIERFISYFKRLVSEVTANPGVKLFQLQMISEAERKRLIYDFNETNVVYPANETVHHLFEEQVERVGDCIALISSSSNNFNTSDVTHMTYKQLNKKANQLCLVLRERGVGSNTIVGVMMERSVEMVIGILAILKAGGAYLPVEPYYPGERIDYMLKDSGGKLVLTQQTFMGRSFEAGCELINVEDFTLYNGSDGNPVPVNTSADLLYVLYTSGSTGTPKGVVIEHCSAVNVLFALYREYPFSSEDTYLFKTPYIFDVSVSELFGWYLGGGRLAILENGAEKDPRCIYNAIKACTVTHINFVPSMFNAFLALLNRESIADLACLKYIFLAGEVLLPGMVKRFRELDSGIHLENLYGPTEGTVYATKYSLSSWNGEGNISIGRPLDNVRVYILNRFGSLQPEGVAGELCLAGSGLAKGYLNQPELSADRFFSPLPLATSAATTGPFTSLYHTGDLARWMSDGNIEFLGRIDHQVKLRGYRIELGEIENQLLKHPEIRETVVINRVGEKGDTYLCAYVVTGNGDSRQIEEKGLTTSAELRKYLSKVLPEYMIPTYFVVLETIPLTPSGKIDRKTLPSPGAKSEAVFIAPRNALETKLARIWSDVLGLPTIGIDDNFFALGGHSLRATVMTARLHKELDVKLLLAQIFKTPTIRGLAEFIRRTSSGIIDGYASIEPAPRKEYYKLSFAQKRLYILQQMIPGGIVYNMPQAIPLGEASDVERIEQTFKRLINRHESLRTSFHMIDEEPVQKIHDEVAFEIPVIRADAELLGNVFNDFVRPFDLSRAPLLRAELVNTEDGQSILLVDMHHIISDGVSNLVLNNDFIALYEGEELPPMRIQYKDFAEWQNSPEQIEAIRRQETFWLQTFSDQVPVLSLPTDYPRPAVQSFEGETIGFDIGSEAASALKTLCLHEGVTMYMVLLAVCNVLLSKLSGQEDIVIGTPVAGRRHADLDPVIGMFVNTLPMRSFPEGEKSFAVFLQEVKESSLLAFENQDYPFEDLVDRLDIKRDVGRNPLFDVMFALQNLGNGTGTGGTGEVSPEITPSLGRNVAKFDLTLVASEGEENIGFSLQYCTRLFKEETITRFVAYFRKIVADVCLDSKTPIGAVEIVTEQERKQILAEFNHPDVYYTADRTIHQLFEEQVQRVGDRIAVNVFFNSDNTHTSHMSHMSYKHLHEESTRLAVHLVKCGVSGNDLVGIMVERSLEMIIGILGILKAGCAYVPLNPKAPAVRNRYILDECGSRLLLTTRVISGELGFQGRIIYLDEPDAYEAEGSGVLIETMPTDLAYVIFTSGSTGKPKGVPISHGNLSPLLHWGYKHLGIDTGDRVIQNLSYYFDWSVWEIFITLTSGARLYIAPDDILLNPESAAAFIRENRITVLHATPTQYSYLAEYKPDTLNYLCIGAEKLTYDLVKRSFESVKEDCRVFNMYGPTEATIISAVMEIKRCDYERFRLLSSVPIGEPAANLDLLVLDKYKRLCPVHVTGELYIAGDGLSAGYLCDPEKTHQVFLENVYQSVGIRGERFYKTGDLCRWLSDGNIEFLGRIDHQVKIRGHRIELGEIENRILQHEGIKEAVVMVRENDGDEKYLCGYVVVVGGYESEGSLSSDLRDYVAAELPDYMIPSYFIEIERMPLNPNGKVDLKALPEPGAVGELEEYAAPRDIWEEKLVEIWSRVLSGKDGSQSALGIDDNFFSLGGHSLNATVMVSHIHKELNVKVPLVQIFTAPTIRGLAEYIRRTGARIVDWYASIEPAPRKEYYKLSFAQKRLYILQQMIPGGIVYNMPQTIPLGEAPDKKRIENTFKRLIRRHESLRTSFHTIDEEPVQVIHEDVEFEMSVIRVDAELLGEVFNRFVRPFDLSLAPLLRAELVNTEDGQSILLVDMHHIISDGVSNQVLIRDFIALFKEQKLPPLRLQYKDYSEWQHQDVQKKEMAEQEQFWLQVFEGEIPMLNLPVDFSRPAEQSYEGNTVVFEISPDITSGLKMIASAEGSTLFMVLLAVFDVLLSRLSGQEDIVVGTPVAGRRHADLEQIIGMFVNTLALRMYPNGRKSFKEFLKEVKERTLAAFENQEYQFEHLVEKVDVRRDVSRNPLFDVMFSLDSMEGEYQGNVEPSDESGSMDSYIFRNRISKFDMTWGAINENDRLSVYVEYCVKLFKDSTINRFTGYFKKIVSQIIDDYDIQISEIEIISEEERKRLLYDFNDTHTEHVGDAGHKTVHELFEEQAQRTGDRIAITANSAHFTHRSGKSYLSHLTYKQLDDDANRLAQVLRKSGVQHDTIVGILTESTLEMIIGILGILKAGGAYLPIDIEYPEERKQYMLNDSNAKLVLTDRDIVEARHVALLQPAPRTSQPAASPASDSLAYIIYTSGTTGRPKGTLVEHRNLAAYVFSFYREFDISENDVVIQQASYSFDAFVEEVYPPLLRGGRIAVPDRDTVKDVYLLSRFIARHQVTLISCSPLLLNELNKEGSVDSIHTFISGGDVLKSEYVGNFIDARKVYNTYGPTETTVCATYYKCCDEGEGPIPIGKPVANYQVYILDKNQKVVPLGVPGELCVSGVGVTRGYMNMPELTAEKFNRGASFSSTSLPLYPSTPLYHTGDLARWLPDGNIEFLGRIDNQVKIRGFRIELGEIESQLVKHEQVKEAVVTARNDRLGEKYLCAYLVCDKEPDISRLRTDLSRDLPGYMVPSYFVTLDTIPRTSTGKIDKRSLPEPGMMGEEDYTAPRDALEEKLVEIWSRVLAGRDGSQKAPGIDDNFFSLGGHSLNATVMVSHIYKEMNVRVPLVQIFSTPTIRGLAVFIRSIGEEILKIPDNNLVLMKKGSPDAPNLFLVHDGSGQVEGYAEFCRLLDVDYNCWGIRADTAAGFAPRNISIRELALNYVKKIKKVQPVGPFHIAGWSLGGTIAFEIVRHLEEVGDNVGFFALIDSPPPRDCFNTDMQPFSLDTETRFINQYLSGGGIEKEFLYNMDTDKFWAYIVELLEQGNIDVELLKKVIFEYEAHVVPGYDGMDIGSLIKYLNMGRTFHNARALYIPAGNINSGVHYFAASQSIEISKVHWAEYCKKPVEYYEVQGDHYSIFKAPLVKKFVKLFCKTLAHVVKS